MNEWTLRAAEARKDGFDGKVEVETVRNGWIPGIFEKENQQNLVMRKMS